jgi:cytoskeletal protein CcmA (bactofilin family)
MVQNIITDEAAPTGVLHNALAYGTTVKGDVTTDGDFRLDGRIEGTISCGGKIVIGPTAQVDGDIISVNAEILGSVVGSITTSEVLVLKPTAVIKGIITTQALVVEPSAKFSGTCNMSLNDPDVEPNSDLPLPNSKGSLFPNSNSSSLPEFTLGPGRTLNSDD